MIGQQCNRGSVTPTRFKVLYNDSNIEEGKLAHLIYSQCFNFQNWTGSVRLPAPSLYAKKLSTFVSANIMMQDPSVKIEGLTANPYFIWLFVGFIIIFYFSEFIIIFQWNMSP